MSLSTVPNTGNSGIEPAARTRAGLRPELSAFFALLKAPMRSGPCPVQVGILAELEANRGVSNC